MSTKGYPSVTINVQHPFPNSRLCYLHSPMQPTRTQASYELLTSSLHPASCILLHCSLHPPPTMYYLPFNLSEEDQLIYLTIMLFALSLCIGGLICIHAPHLPPPRLIAAWIIQVIWAFQIIVSILSFFCEGAVMLLTTFH